MREHDQSAATGAPGELVIDADQVEFRSAPAYPRVFLPKKFHPMLGEKFGGHVLSVRINLVVSVAAPDT